MVSTPTPNARPQPVPDALQTDVTDELPAALPEALHQLLYRRVLQPLGTLLRMGASPRRLAWSIAIGLLIGINPLVGSTTLVCLAAAFILRLNLAASQLANHSMYPVQILLLLPFLHISSRLFHSAPFTLAPEALYAAARSHPVELIRQVWVWEWHALVLWAALALLLVAPLAELLHTLLRRLNLRLDNNRSDAPQPAAPAVTCD